MRLLEWGDGMGRDGTGGPGGSLGIMHPPWGQTIFEINATSRTPASTVMRSKRRHDHALIEKFQRGQQEKRAAALKGQGLCPAPPKTQDGEGEQEDLQVMGSWMQELPQSILGLVLAAPGPPDCAGAWGLVQRLAGMLGGTWLPNPSTVPIQDVFSNVGGQKRKRGRGGEDGPRKKPQQLAQQDEDFYIPYRPKDFESERG